MIELMGRITGVATRASVKTNDDGKIERHTHLTIKIDVKEGEKNIPQVSKMLEKPVNLHVEELQPGLIPEEK